MKRLFILLAVLAFAAPVIGDPPSTFDLRDVGGENYVSAVKSQEGGTCWTHGAMSAIEGNLLMTGAWSAAGESGEPNLAEYHLDWWNGFNEHNNDDLDPPWGSGLEVHYGGDYLVTSAYLTRGEGAVRDIDGQSYNDPPLRDDPSYHYYYPRDIEWFTAGADLSNIDTIKNYIMAEGVLGTCMCYDSGFIDDNYIHYQPPSSSYDPNHAIAIIGWDDAKSTQAPLPGAWLCKNSWGDWWGFDGFFWISYYDKHCCQHPEMGAISFQDVEPMQYDMVYYHDYHGRRDVKVDTDEAFNRFTSAYQGSVKEVLTAVSFYTAAENVSYMVEVYDRFEGGGLLNVIASAAGALEHAGFHTVNLDASAILTPGDDFFVAVSLSDGGHAYDRSSEVPVLLGFRDGTLVESAAAEGESYYREGGAWSDLYFYDDPPWSGTANFCIKALTTFEALLDFDYPDDLPELIHPDGGTTFPVVVSGLDPEPGTGLLHYDAGAGFVQTPMIEQEPNVYDAVFPAIPFGVKVRFYLSAETAVGQIVTDPLEAPGIAYEAMSATGSASIYLDDFSVNAGWTGLGGDGEWAIGPATGGIGGDDKGGPDPSLDHSASEDNGVMGNDLDPGTGGDYDRNINGTDWATSSSIDCSGYTGVTFSFYRWLGVEGDQYDHVYIEVYNGSSWQEIFANGEITIDERSWGLVSYDVSAYADDNPGFKVRFGMGSTDSGWHYCGWNIDDLEILGYTYEAAHDVTIEITPDSPPVIVPPGGSFEFSGSITSNESVPVSVDAWIMVEEPDGDRIGPARAYYDIPMAAGQVRSFQAMAQNIPLQAPPGEYTYIGYVGTYPAAPSDSSSFVFTITE